MSVLGFSEAFVHREIIQITDQPPLYISVASLPGLILLKLIAWADRPRELRPKDAEDIKYIIKSNVKIDSDVSGIWEAVDLLEKYEGDIDLVSANILGGRVGQIANQFSREFITSTFDSHTEPLAVDMGSPTGDLDENLALISAFFEGFGIDHP